MARNIGIAAGLGTQAFFLFTVWHLFWFLRGPHESAYGVSQFTNVLLALQFAIPHSLLLHPRARTLLARWIPRPFYGSFFCVMTCLSLWVMFVFWQSSSVILWQATGIGRWLVTGAFAGSWVGLFYSLSLTGLGYQTGWTPWWYWYLRQPEPRRVFTPRGLYRWFRHPVYLSFLGLIWFTPDLTLDRVLLLAVWTAYIFYGSMLKDQRLEHYLGESYRHYESQVPGYPLVSWGRLGRINLPSVSPSHR